jgi:hypothetical protein
VKNSSSWKNMERKVASWFGSTRNPLSGRNNVDDNGERRLGDIVYPHAAIEVKQKKTVSMVDVDCIRVPAVAARKPWLLLEFKKGAANLVKLTMDHATAEYVCGCLDVKWRDDAAKRNVTEGA